MSRRSIKNSIRKLVFSSKVGIIIFTLACITTANFIVAILLHNEGLFTIAIPRSDMLEYGLVISETENFDRQQIELRADPVKDMWNITETDIPANVDRTPGSHNGENYLAYTFYVKNMGESDLDYNASIDISDMHLNVDDAMRVKIYLNGTPGVYAKRKSTSSEPEPGTIPFVAKTRIINMKSQNLAVGKINKYTVVVWLEGEDPDCVNSILGGSVKMKMNFTVLRSKALV